MKSRTILWVFGMFVLTLGAGVAAGVLAARLPGSSQPDSSSTITSPLAEELNLTPDQEARMKPIWEDVRATAHDCLAQARKIQTQRDDAIVTLLTDEQKTKYAKISSDYVQEFSDLNAKRDKAFQQGVEKTLQLLNDSQRERYKKIVLDRTGRMEGESAPTETP